MGKLTTEVFNESCCDGGAGSSDNCDSRALAERHAEEHASSINLTPRRMGECLTQGLIQRGDSTTTTIASSVEVRVVDPLTGGEKGSKIERYDLIPPEILKELAQHYGKGARKYADRNWERGYKWGLSYAACMRHLEAWRMGEDSDLETGSNHLVAALWHLVALRIFQLRGLGTDDLRVV